MLIFSLALQLRSWFLLGRSLYSILVSGEASCLERAYFPDLWIWICHSFKKDHGCTAVAIGRQGHSQQVPRLSGLAFTLLTSIFLKVSSQKYEVFGFDPLGPLGVAKMKSRTPDTSSAPVPTSVCFNILITGFTFRILAVCHEQEPEGKK